MMRNVENMYEFYGHKFKRIGEKKLRSDWLLKLKIVLSAVTKRNLFLKKNYPI